MRRRLEQQVLQHADPERLRLMHSAQVLSLRLKGEAHLPLGYRDVLINVLGVLRATVEQSRDVGHWRAAVECWNAMASQVNDRFPLQVPLPMLEKPHPEF